MGGSHQSSELPPSPMVSIHLWWSIKVCMGSLGILTLLHINKAGGGRRSVSSIGVRTTGRSCVCVCVFVLWWTGRKGDATLRPLAAQTTAEDQSRQIMGRVSKSSYSYKVTREFFWVLGRSAFCREFSELSGFAVAAERLRSLFARYSWSNERVRAQRFPHGTEPKDESLLRFPLFHVGQTRQGSVNVVSAQMSSERRTKSGLWVGRNQCSDTKDSLMLPVSAEVPVGSWISSSVFAVWATTECSIV